MRKIIVLVTAILFITTGIVSARQETKFEASLEMNRVSLGNPLYLYLTFYGAQDVDEPALPAVNGLQIKYIGPSTKMSIVNRKVTQSLTYTYLVIPLKEGKYELGPFFTEHGGKMYKTDIVTLRVSGTPDPNAPSGPVPYNVPTAPYPTGSSFKKSSYTDDRIFLRMEVGKTQVYVNEAVSLTLKIYVNGVGLKDIEYPSFSHEGFSVGEFSEPEKRREVYRGVAYDVLIFKQDLYAIKEGDYRLGPARVNCKIVERKRTARRSSLFGRSIFDDDFFSNRFGYNTLPVELESDEIHVSILPFPEEGRPADFQGAMGDFSMDAFIDPSRVKVGDPVVLRMVISGLGNLDTVTAPGVQAMEDFKTYEPQVTKKGNQKIYEQIFIPKTDEAREIPGVAFSFFNPRTRRYHTIRKGPFPVTVIEQPESERKVKMVTMAGKEQIFYPEEKLGQDIIHIKESSGSISTRGKFLYRNWLFWAGQVIPFFMLVGFFAVERKRKRMLTDKSYARLLKAPRNARGGLSKAKAYIAKDDILPFYDVIFKTLQDYLGGRLDLPKGNITMQVLEDRLRPSGCDEDQMQALREIFSKCEMARYASSVPGGDEAEEVLQKVRKIIDYLEKARV